MPRQPLCLPFVDGLTLLGFALVFLWLRLLGLCPRELCCRVVLTVTGYLRRRPDHAAENALRAVFAEFDQDLAAILGDRTRRDRPGP